MVTSIILSKFLCSCSHQNGPHPEKPENSKLACSKLRYDTITKDTADQSAWMPRLVCAFVVCNPQTDFLTPRTF